MANQLIGKNRESIDVKKIMQQIRAEIARKKEAGFYQDLIEPSLDPDFLLNNSLSNSIDAQIDGLNSIGHIVYNKLTPSERPVFGPLVTFVKRLIRKFLVWYFKSITDQINVFNNQIINTLRLIHQDKNAQSISPLWENNYIKFEDRFRGSEKEILEKQKVILTFFDGLKNILDIGCGRGEFLELLNNNGIETRGIDTNISMVNNCLEKGLSVTQADALNYLKVVPDNTFGGIFLGQIVEHMGVSYLSNLLQLSISKIKKNGIIVIETPNPLSITVSAINFSRDLTHLKILHPDTLVFLLESTGFIDFNIKFMSDYPNDQKLQLQSVPKDSNPELKHNIEIFNKNIKRLNSVIFGAQDYVVTARKP